jgi:alkylation response protein AidB-like acyl-CoA dehydrogenase
MNNLKAIYRRIFRKARSAEQPSSGRSLNDHTAMAQKMMEMIVRTEEVELTCDDVFDLLDEFTEMALRGENVADLMPMVQHHLGMCPECREEYEALRRVIEHGRFDPAL